MHIAFINNTYCPNRFSFNGHSSTSEFLVLSTIKIYIYFFSVLSRRRSSAKNIKNVIKTNATALKIVTAM